MSAVLDISDSDEEPAQSRPAPAKAPAKSVAPAKKINIFSRRFKPELEEESESEEEDEASPKSARAASLSSPTAKESAADDAFGDAGSAHEDSELPETLHVQEISDDSSDSDDDAKPAPKKKQKVSAQAKAIRDAEMSRDPAILRLLELKRRNEMERKLAAEAWTNIDSAISPPRDLDSDHEADERSRAAPESKAGAAAAESAPAPAAPENKRAIILKMVCANGPKWSKKFKVNMDTRFSQMADHIIATQNLTGVKFQVDGETLDLSKTPESLDIDEDEDECQVDVIFQPPG